MRRSVAVIAGLLLVATPVYATDFSSTNFSVKDPVLIFGGGLSTSSGYSLEGSIGALAPGSSTGSSFGLRSGPLYFTGLPSPPSGLSASAASQSQINISWTDNSVNEAGFLLERRTGAGSYSEIAGLPANTSSYSDSGLAAGTTYLYRVRAYTNDGNSAYSGEAGATTPAQASSGGGGGGGGGGGFGGPIVSGGGGASLIGRAYPKSAITILVDGVVRSTITADSSASFNTQLDVPAGVKSFSLYATDPRGRRSLTYSFTLNIASGIISSVSGIFLAPTIDVDKSEVRKGDALNILGQTAPSTTVSVVVNSEHQIVKTVAAGADGTYFLSFDTSSLELGEHSARSQSVHADESQSPFSQAVNFRVSNKNVNRIIPGDLNKSGTVNIVDFSILLFWWGKSTPQALEVADVNKDKKVNLTDLSVLLYYWNP